MRIWRELLRLSSELFDQSGHAVIDATYFDRRQASKHSLKRSEREVQTVQATFPVDTAQGAVIDVHYSAKGPNGDRVLRHRLWVAFGAEHEQISDVVVDIP